MSKEKWLDDMIDAALETPTDPSGEPDFTGIAAEALKRDRRGGRSPWKSRTATWALPAAAAILAAAISTPLGIAAGRRSEERRINREIQEMFVDGLIGDSLFDEGLTDHSHWLMDIEIDETFFEI